MKVQDNRQGLWRLFNKGLTQNKKMNQACANEMKFLNLLQNVFQERFG